MKYPEIKNFIDGKFTSSEGKKLDVTCPLNGEVISNVPLSTITDLDKAITAAKKAFPLWSGLTSKKRAEVLFSYRAILKKNLNELAEIIHYENGKNISDATAEVEKSIELTEFACSVPQIISGDIMKVSEGVTCRTEYTPLGVVASITPFNFPNMVPHWTIPNAIALGNCMILKPSEVVPVTAVRIAEMLKEAGLPDGVFNIVNGGKEIVEAICDHPDIKAISFVGSTDVAKIVYKRSTSNLKRSLTLGSAKNHLIVLSDANPDLSATDITASFTGTAGQRCMAASVLIAVGKTDHILEKIIINSRKIKPGLNLGPIISKKAREKIINYINKAENAGATILLDGRKTEIDSSADKAGFYLGPTILDYTNAKTPIPLEEVFGPVMEIIRVDTLDEAINIQKRSRYGNASSVFTQSGGVAEEVAKKVNVGMVGINIGVPVPREPFSFGGWNDSKFGVGDITGKSSIEFWTQLKKITGKWSKQEKQDWMS
ncbi:MAG: CoA-acylating methylmalonate-semialdehyde dehydrogenase [Bacteroidales bacterium]|nr:CoA-acylating methylmalonate-semialdehyde dehydrogenase [Bacteroidales bacterium]